MWAEGKDIGLKRGLTIGMVDYLSAGLAGRLFKTSSVLDAPLKKYHTAFLKELHMIHSRRLLENF